MADTNMNKNQNNETMQREKAKASVAGGRTPEQGKSDEDRREKSAIGGENRSQGNQGQSGGQTQSGNQTQSGGQAMSGPSSTGPAMRGQNDKSRESDRSRSEPAGR